MQINTESVLTDISKDEARRAYYWTSFDPERNGERIINSYIATMKDLAIFIEENAKDEKQQAIAQEVFDNLKSKYLTRYKKWIAAQSRCISSMITGPARFPINRAERANSAERARSDELSEFSKNLKKYALDNLQSIYTKVEKMETEQERLEKDLQSMKENHANMKLANAQFKKGGWDNVTCLSEKSKNELIEFQIRCPFYNRQPFYPFSLSNNLANIKRVEERIEEFKKKAEKREESGGAADKHFKGLIVRYNYDEDRIQLLFETIPTEIIRSALKSNGFKWSPRFKAWQRQITGNANFALKHLLISENFQEFRN